MNTTAKGTTMPNNTNLQSIWSDRNNDPESARAQLRAAADAMPTHHLAEQCGTSFNELNTFLRPGIDPAVFASCAGDRQATVNLLWAYKQAGWSGADMARAAGISRQRIHALMKTSPTETVPAPVKPLQRRRDKPAPKFRQVASLPDFEIKLLDTLAAEFHAGSLPAAARLRGHMNYLHNTYRTSLDHLAARCKVDRDVFYAVDEKRQA